MGDAVGTKLGSSGEVGRECGRTGVGDLDRERDRDQLRRRAVTGAITGEHTNDATAILITWDDWGGFYDHRAPV